MKSWSPTEKPSPARGEGASIRIVRGLARKGLPVDTANPMTDDNATDEISDIEDRIEALAKTAQRCRKFILASKVAIAGGFALLLVTVLGLFGAGQAAALASIALVLGGIVSLGSNISTLRQTDAAISDAEAIRSELISGIDLQMVHDTPTKLM